jgi:type II secretory pathway component GspD/PulD (secretin)
MAHNKHRRISNARQWVACLAIVLLVAPCLPLFAQDDASEPAAAPTASAPVQASFSFKNAKASDVMLALGELYGIQFVGAADVTAPIALVSEQPVDANGALALLDAALASLNKGMVREGDVVRIINRSRTPTQVQIVRLKYADPQRVAEVITQLFQTRDLLSAANTENQRLIEQLLPAATDETGQLLSGQFQVMAIPYPQLRAVIIRAPEAAMPIIRNFIETQLDEATPPTPSPPPPPPPHIPPQKSQTYLLKFVPADYFAGASQRLLNIPLLVEPRINGVILRSSSPEHFAQVEQLIDLLDIPDVETDEIFHVTLTNAVATEVQRVLQETYRITQTQPFSEEGYAELTEQQKALADQIVQAGVDRSIAEQLVTGHLAVPVGEVYIVADPSNNALLIRTNPRNIDAILDIIEQLDQVRGQVLINVFIAEVRLDDTLEFGIDFLYNSTTGDGSYVVGQDFDLRNAAISTGLTYSLVSDNLTAFLRALQSSAKLDVISRPQIVTMDNQPAYIEFGQRVPLLQTTQITPEGTVNTTVNYENVTTRLEVTPHVNAAGFVRMEIMQKIDDVSADTFAITEQLAPNILITRRAQTNVQIRDGQTVLFGGFITDTVDEIEDKIPILGDLPYINSAFKNIKHTRVKNELLIFITPYILKTPEELLAVTNQRRLQATVVGRPDRNMHEMQVQTETDPAQRVQDQPVTRKLYTVPPAPPQGNQPPVTDDAAPPQDQPLDAPADVTLPSQAPTEPAADEALPDQPPAPAEAIPAPIPPEPAP